MSRKKQKRKKIEWKTQLKFELIGLSLLIISVIAFARLGSVGEVMVRLFRFFVGEWNVVMIVGLFITSIFIMVKRQYPSLFTRKLIGGYILLLSFLLLSHLRLFDLLEGENGFEDRSVIRNTWSLFWLQMSGEAPTMDLGGGMIGALGFAVSHFLFDSLGTYLISFFCFAVAVILITGKSLTEMSENCISY